MLINLCFHWLNWLNCSAYAPWYETRTIKNVRGFYICTTSVFTATYIMKHLSEEIGEAIKLFVTNNQGGALHKCRSQSNKDLKAKEDLARLKNGYTIFWLAVPRQKCSPTLQSPFERWRWEWVWGGPGVQFNTNSHFLSKNLSQNLSKVMLEFWNMS